MCEGVWSGEEGMIRALIYTLDAIGEYTIAEDTGDSVTLIGQVEEESDARLFCAAPELLEALQHGQTLNLPDMLDWVADRLVYVHGENQNLDFISSLRNRARMCRAAIAKALGETK